MKKFKIAIICGEESGDQLGADLINALRKEQGYTVDLIGVGGQHLENLGLKSYFPMEDIALMGIGAILKKLPLLLKHIKDIVKFFATQKPDCLLIIDSQEFTHRVAQKLKKICPNIPIIQYVAPSVWAWREERAQKMTAYIDHVFLIFPFELEVMKRLNGPESTYLGHRLMSYPLLLQAKSQRKDEKSFSENKTLLLLPGSRRFEIDNLLPIFLEALEHLKKANPNLQVILPTLPRLKEKVKGMCKDCAYEIKIVDSEEAKWDSFAVADAALAASGTVSLELALCHIPMILAYKADFFSRIFIQKRIKIWSAALPNIITDKPIVPEFFNEFVRPVMLAKQVNYLLHNKDAINAQHNGFLDLETKMKTEAAAGTVGAKKIIEVIEKNKSL